MMILGWLMGGLPRWLFPLVITVAIIAAIFSAYVKGRIDSSAKCREAQLTAELEMMKRDRDVARQAEAEAEALAKSLADNQRKLEDEVNAYEKELASRPDASCRLNSRDLERLR